MTISTSSGDHAGFLPTDYGQLIEKPLREVATALNPAVAGLIRIDGHSIDIPVVNDDAAAAFIAEGTDIGIDDAEFDTHTVTPVKVAGISVITREMAEDSSPEAGQVVANGLAQSIARKMDLALFTGLSSPAPAGLATNSDVHEILWEETSVDSFLDGIGYMRGVGANPTAIVVSAADYTGLSKLKEATDSNRGLLTADVTVPTLFALNGVPIIPSAGCPTGTAYIVDNTKLYTVMRSDTTVEIDDSVYFVSDRRAVKARARVGFGLPHPEALVRLVVAGS